MEDDIQSVKQVNRGAKPVIIAHRGACGYLPEHTLPAKAMAYAMGADFLEQDVVLTRDNRAILVHDRFLDTVTDVARRYPKRRRIDGRYYAIDFTLKEIKGLRAHERVDHATRKPIYPARFPVDAVTRFEITTLEEEIEMIQGMNRSTGKDAGIYVELKGPAFHRSEGKPIEEIVLDILGRYGYASRDANCYLQCFEPESLIYMRNHLRCDLKMVQLIGDNSWEETPGVDYPSMLTEEGLDRIALYADAIGPWTYPIVAEFGFGKEIHISELVDWSHVRNLAVHVFTFRADALPSYVSNFDELLDLFFIKVGVDGIFTDFPDRVDAFLRQKGLR